MKRFVCIIITAAIAAALITGCFAEFKASFSLTGPGSIRAGNTLTVQFKADGNGICGILADITYDNSKLTYKSQSGTLADWKVEVTEKSGVLQIWAEENNSFKSPIKSQKTVVSLNFKVSDKVTVDEKITVKANVKQVSDTENELSGLSASYSVTVARPLSSDSSLKSLSVDGYKLKPDFSTAIKEYEIEGEAEYTLNALKINAVSNDTESSVDISGARLSVGDNTIRVKVTAENGDSTTYTIKVKMKQDPDYVPSPDADLSVLNLSEGRLSPEFTPDRFDYIVYVPYEVAEFTVEGTPEDGKAKAETEGETALSEGENLFTVKCTAEDGSIKEYRVTVMRMGEYEPVTDTDTETETETDTEEITEITETDEPDTETEETTDIIYPDTDTETESSDGNETSLDKKVPLWLLVVGAAGGVILGAFATILVAGALKERK